VLAAAQFLRMPSGRAGSPPGLGENQSESATESATSHPAITRRARCLRSGIVLICFNLMMTLVTASGLMLTGAIKTDRRHLRL